MTRPVLESLQHETVEVLDVLHALAWPAFRHWQEDTSRAQRQDSERRRRRRAGSATRPKRSG